MSTQLQPPTQAAILLNEYVNEPALDRDPGCN